MIKYWNMKRLSGLHSSEDIPDFTNHKISESNIKCEKCTSQFLNDILEHSILGKTTYSSESPE